MQTSSQSKSSIIVWLGMLAMSSSMVGQFIIFGVPLFLREAGASSQSIGLVFLAAIPFVARFLWAPLVDRFGRAQSGHYRTWIIATQSVVCPLLLCMSMLDPGTQVVFIVVCLLLLAVSIGTQVMAVDAITVRHVSAVDTPRALSFQKGGSAVAGFGLGGVLIFGLGHLGWWAVVLAIFGIHTLVLVGVLLFAKLDLGQQSPSNLQPYSVKRYASVFRRNGVLWIFGITLFVTMGADIPYALKSILLKDAGLTVSQAGLIGIFLANLSGLVAVFVARALIERFGGFVVLNAIGFLSVSLAVGFVGMEGILSTKWLTAGFVIAAGALVYAASVAEASLLYPRVDKVNPASEVSTFNACQGVLLLAINSAATQRLDSVGLNTILMVAIGVSVLGIGLASWRLFLNRRTTVSLISNSGGVHD